MLNLWSVKISTVNEFIGGFTCTQCNHYYYEVDESNRQNYHRLTYYNASISGIRPGSYRCAICKTLWTVGASYHFAIIVEELE